MNVLNKATDFETERVEIMNILDRQPISDDDVKWLSYIQEDLENLALLYGTMWATTYAFSLGKMYGIHKERDRRAKRDKASKTHHNGKAA